MLQESVYCKLALNGTAVNGIVYKKEEGQKKQNKKAIRQNPLEKSQLNNFSNLWNILLFP